MTTARSVDVYRELEATVLPSMEAYQTDLTTHDRAAIERNPGVPFLHWTGKSSTVIVFLAEADDDSFPPAGVKVPYLFGTADREHLADEMVSMADYFLKPCNSKPLFVHHFDGERLRRIDIQKAAEIARQHRRKLEREWLHAAG